MKQYTKEDISQLLSRFMDGTTTLEEEDVLARYFAGADVPAEWEDYRQLFCELEAMKPQAKGTPARLQCWRHWSAAAALVISAAVGGAALLSQHTEPTALHTEPTAPHSAPLVAQTDRQDSTSVLRPEPPNQEVAPDTTALRRQQQQPPRHRRRLRKPEPTLTDYDKGYALLAKAQDEVEQELEAYRTAALHAALTAQGYIAIRHEDGTIEYIKEDENLLTYEE